MNVLSSLKMSKTKQIKKVTKVGWQGFGQYGKGRMASVWAIR